MTTQSVEDILRPLVEATVRTWEAPGPEPIGGTLFTEAPDPRFDALRCPPRVYCHEEGIHADLGAIREAMVACGWTILNLSTYGKDVYAEVQHSSQIEEAGFGRGATDAEAAARALVAAWRDEKGEKTWERRTLRGFF